MLERGVVVTPGVGFGPAGEGFIRMALTQPVKRIEEALERMGKAL
jgi:LL-diaminopimelate aminotransferase